MINSTIYTDGWQTSYINGFYSGFQQRAPVCIFSVAVASVEKSL